MIIAKISKWNDTHTELSKYFIEKLLQLTDYEEIITNRHKTTNGYILLSEINEVSRLVINRQKSVYRFSSLLKECIDKNLNSSLINDPIIKKYHKDIIDYYKSIDINVIEKDQNKIKKLQTQTRVYIKKLELEYYDNLKTEFINIDLKSGNFRKNQKVIDSLLEILIPYLIYVGYSTESISKIALILSIKNVKKLFTFFFSVFNLKNKKVEYLLSTSEDHETNNSLLKYLADNNISISHHKLTDFELEDKENMSENIVKFEVSTLDPNSFIRHTYDHFIKDFIISKDRTSLHYFTNFFDKTYWKLPSDDKKDFYRKSGFNHDPINVTTRNSTLRETLIKVSDYYNLNFEATTPLYKIETISESLYFYNLALGSKSIENSLNLLWTALETLIPYGKYDSDIVNIQYFFPKFLSCGSIGRQLMSFIMRFQMCNSTNGFSLNTVKSSIDYKSKYQVENTIKWLDFIITKFNKEDDPYTIFKTYSELLCTQFCTLNETWGQNVEEPKEFGKVKLWQDRIDGSRLSMEYQLDRIYLHRNQIVHTAKFINEYSNLWTHLEWYVGKILAYFYIKSSQYKNINLNKKDILIELEGECEMIYQLVNRNAHKNIIDLTNEEKKKIFMQIWQFM